MDAAQNRDGASVWKGHPIAAACLRAALFLLPIVLGWAGVRLCSSYFYQPSGWYGPVAWVIQAIAVGVAVGSVARWATDRLAPFAVLLSISLVFPSTAPSRFGVALRSGSTKRMAEAVPELSSDVSAAAEQALELVARLRKHEPTTRGHVERVRAYGELIGAELGLAGEELDKLRWGLLLHDIGKLKVPAEILNKDGAPDEEEWAVLREHPAWGAEMVEPLRPWLGSWIDAAGSHHEKWSGTGYPLGLSGAEIPLAGRICAVADAYDVMTSKRSYKAPQSHATARAELVDCAGSHFDPAVVRAMLRVAIQRRRRTSLLGWLLEFPGLVEVAAHAAKLPIAPIAVAAGVATATLTGAQLPELPDAVPDELADVADIGGDLSGDNAAFATTIAPTPSTIVPTTQAADPVDTEPPAASADPELSPTTVQASSTTEPNTSTTDQGSQPTQPQSSSTTVGPATTTTTAPPPAESTTVPTTAATTTTTVPETTTTVSVPPDPVGSGFQLLDATDVPASLAADQLESATDVFLFLERSALTLSQPLTVRSVQSGMTVPISEWASETVLPAGTVICSWFIHFDPAPGVLTIETTITLPNPIIGYGGWPIDLSRSDFLALPGVNYHYDQSDLGDFLRIDGSTVVGTFSAFPARTDHLRVYTSC